MTSSPADAPDLNAILGSGTGDELTPEQLAALARLDDGPFGCDEDDDPNGAGFGPDTRPPDGWDLMTPAAQQALLGARSPTLFPRRSAPDSPTVMADRGWGSPRAGPWTGWRPAAC